MPVDFIPAQFVPGPELGLLNRPFLQALLQDILPASNHLQDLHHSQQDLSKRPYPTAADYLEYVDKQTGFTPLLAAVRYHRGQCAKLVRVTHHSHHTPVLFSTLYCMRVSGCLQTH